MRRSTITDVALPQGGRQNHLQADGPSEPKLTGKVEMNETFVGSKAKRKAAVVALVERQGMARVKVITSVTQKKPGVALGGCVSWEAVVNTDEHPSYKHALTPWKAHEAEYHSHGECHR